MTEPAVGPGAIWVLQPADNHEPGPHSAPTNGNLVSCGGSMSPHDSWRSCDRPRAYQADLVVDKHGAWVTDGLNRTLIAIPR